MKCFQYLQFCSEYYQREIYYPFLYLFALISQQLTLTLIMVLQLIYLIIHGDMRIVQCEFYENLVKTGFESGPDGYTGQTLSNQEKDHLAHSVKPKRTQQRVNFRLQIYTSQISKCHLKQLQFANQVISWRLQFRYKKLLLKFFFQCLLENLCWDLKPHASFACHVKGIVSQDFLKLWFSSSNISRQATGSTSKMILLPVALCRDIHVLDRRKNH